MPSLTTLFQQETQHFLQHHPKSITLSNEAQKYFLFGVPLHWMRDWPMPASLFIESAQGITLKCADGHSYRDFCLGDTGAMFGHSPPAVASALAVQAQRGLTSMLPACNANRVGQLLNDTFGVDTGLSRWQLTLSASDANRFVLRWVRAITGRSQVLVFDGCYHGAVDDTLVDMDPVTHRTLARPSILGAVHNHADFTRVVPFNDLEALEAALRDGQVAALLAEPALTNFGLVPPDEGFWQTAVALCKRYGTLVIMDETHTISTAHGGYTRAQRLQPDFFVVGKAIAGGLPCGVYGFSEEMAQKMQEAKEAAPDGHSGIGTTLSGNAMTFAALEATLSSVNTAANYQHMLDLAEKLESAMLTRIAAHSLPWTVTRLGARMELQFMPHTPRNADDVRKANASDLERFTHLFMLNRGILLTPFHSMMLCSIATTEEDVAAYIDVFESLCQTIKALD